MPQSQSISEILYRLYVFPRSSCAQRIRIALSLKAITNVIIHNVDLETDAHHTEAYRAINPSANLPTLVVEKKAPSGHVTRFVLTHSTAILEYFEEALPDKFPLLSPVWALEQRARVRELMAVITQNMYPLAKKETAGRIHEIRNSKSDEVAFVTAALVEGFDTYETMLKRYGGFYSAGDHVTLADVCLVPQVLQARMYGVDACGSDGTWPLINGVVERLEAIEAFGREIRVERRRSEAPSTPLVLKYHAQVWG